MAALVVSVLLLAFGAAFYALGLLRSRRGSFGAELRVTLDLLREGEWSPAETLLIASRRTLGEREASHWLEHRGSALLRLACETSPTREIGSILARVRFELETHASGGETRTHLQFCWPGRSGGAEPEAAELLLERIARELC